MAITGRSSLARTEPWHVETECLVRKVHYKLDASALHRSPDYTPLPMNDLACVTLHPVTPLYFDSYKKRRQLTVCSSWMNPPTPPWPPA